jgi:hypothetical protein
MLLEIILVIILLISVTLNVFLYKGIVIQEKKLDIYEDWIQEFQRDVENTYLQMKEIDQKEIFSKDDEVGSSFTQILELLNKLSNRTDETNETEKE